MGLFGDIATINSATDITALDNANNKTIINEFYNITKALVTDDTLATTKANLNTLFRKYKNITEGKFEVTKEQGLNVKEVVSNTIFNGVSVINDKYIKMDKETNEYASILSYAFNVGNEAREYLFKECNKNKENRFLSFFTLRYGVNFKLKQPAQYGIAKRRFWESELFGFEYNANNAYKLSIGIFQILNFKYKPRPTYNTTFVDEFKKAYPNQTHLDWILKYENDFLYAKKNKKQTWQEFYNQDAKANNLNIRLQNIQGITPNKDSFLSPYLDYINFTFAKGTISQYALENIYVLADTRDCENLTIALQERGDTRELTALLIICLKPNRDSSNNTPTYSFKQPSNTFLSIVVFEEAKLDVSGIDTRNSEILYAKSDTTSNIIAHLLLGSKQSMEKENDNTLKAIGDMGDTKETCIFEKAPHSDDNSHLISPILRIYNDKINNPNDFIEIHNFAKDEIG